ncbi:MAG: phosphate ABC transporter substrate-binding protein [Spirochaetaceae bacterium]|jgi:phosphate transport system substrate-binding protein|nr:phosphate ABC transporter substrate-binding protein [Spirochaetaceae bacterium]
MKKIMLVMLVLVAALTLVMANGQGDGQGESGFSGSYAFGGSTTLEPIFMDVNTVMEARYSIQLSYDAPGSSAGVSGVLDGTYPIGAASRELKAQEIEAGAVATPVGVDGVAIVVNKDSVAVDNLSIQQIVDIYSGVITNWSDVGGADAEIVVLNRDEASGTRSCFKDSTVKEAGVDFVSDAIIVTSNGDMVSKVGSTPYAIGYCGFGYIGKDGGTKTVSIDAIDPDEENVVNGSYAISRNLNVITLGELADGSFEKFYLDYMLSTEGQQIVKALNFIPLN